MAAHGNTDPKKVKRLAPKQKNLMYVAPKQKKLDIAPKQRKLDVAPHKSWGLVWFVPARRERETGIAPVLGRLVFLNRILDVELENRWCLHVNEQGKALIQCL